MMAGTDELPAEIVPWRQRLEKTTARVRRERGSNFVQLSTVDPSGHPRNRTVVMRGWVGDAIKMITDARSSKVEHIQHSPSGEVVWWFPKTREQYRIAGDLQLVGKDEPDAGLAAQRKQQ